MCGRFTLRTPTPVLMELFRLSLIPDAVPRYNIAPTQEIVTIRVTGERGSREGLRMRWGLVPSWAKDPSISARMINARAESLAEKPSFRVAFRRRRCVVPADGYFEWRSIGKAKQPYLIQRSDGKPFLMAGLWESWSGAAGAKLQDPLLSCTIVTTAATGMPATVHDRMPVILNDECATRWLDLALDDPTEIKPILDQATTDGLEIVAVNPCVNNARHDHPQCVEPWVSAGT